MLRKYALFIGVAALGALVTSCGGDDSTVPTPTPTPTDTSTATPTPTPTPTPVVFSLTEEFLAQSVNANLSYAFFVADGSTDSTFSGASRVNGNAAFELLFDPESARLGFPDLNDVVTFTDADFDAVTMTTRSYSRATESLLIELPFEHILRTNYVLDQSFIQDTTPGTLTANRATLYFSPVTTDTDIASVLTYAGSVQVFGGDPNVTAEGAISSPDITLTVTPGATDADPDTVAGTIRIIEDVMGTPTEVAVFTIAADLTSVNGFTVEVEDTTNMIAGSVSGSLAGPDREEALLIFSASSSETDNDTRFVGTFIGER